MTEAPAEWLVDNLAALRPGGRVLDVACGRGRHLRFLAERGWTVHGVDRDVEALGALVAAAPARRVTVEALDLETGSPPLAPRAFDGVIVFNYLHRPLLPAIVEAVAPGGVLIYETFTTAQAEHGRPRNPAFLLQPGELMGLVAPLRVERSREGEWSGRHVASVVARRVVP